MEEDGQIIVYGEVADFHSIQEALKEKKESLIFQLLRSK